MLGSPEGLVVALQGLRGPAPEGLEGPEFEEDLDPDLLVLEPVRGVEGPEEAGLRLLFRVRGGGDPAEGKPAFRLEVEVGGILSYDEGLFRELPGQDPVLHPAEGGPDVEEDIGDELGVAIIRDRLVGVEEVVEGFLELPEVEAYLPDIAECRGFPGPVAGLARVLEAPRIVVHGTVIAAEVVVGRSRGAFSALITPRELSSPV